MIKQVDIIFSSVGPKIVIAAVMDDGSIKTLPINVKAFCIDSIGATINFTQSHKARLNFNGGDSFLSPAALYLCSSDAEGFGWWQSNIEEIEHIYLMGSRR